MYMKKILALATAVAALAACAFGAQQQAPQKHRKVAVQTYSLNRFSLEESIEKLKGLGLDGVEIYPGQRLYKKGKQKFGPQMSKADRDKVKKMLADANLKVVSFGVTGANSERQIEQICEFAKDMGIERVLTESPIGLLPAWNEIGKKYGVTMCLHHHAKDSRNQWWMPEIMGKYARTYENVKSNPDVGHWSRCAINPVEALKKLDGTIGSVHFKDQKEFGNPRNQPVPFGEGDLDVKGMLKELDRQGYDGFFVIEYEGEWNNNIPSIRKCVQYLRNN